MSNDGYLGQSFGTREGEYFPGFRGRFQGLAQFNSGVDRNTDFSDQFKAASFIDQGTGVFVSAFVLDETKIVSPLTGLLVNGPDQDKLKRQLGVTQNVFRLQTIDPDLNTFDPIAELENEDPDIVADAERLLAANLRALALTSALALRCDTSFGFGDRDELQMALASAPDQFLFNDNAAMSGVVANIAQFSQLQTDVQSAVAHLIDAYAAAVALRIDSPEFSARFLMGIEGFLVPRVEEVCQANTSEAAATALAITAEDIRQAVVRFEESIPATTDGLFFPGPDYYETQAGTTLKLIDDPNTGLANPYPSFNDFFAGPNNSPVFGRVGVGDIETVEVPAINSGEISASINADGDIMLTPATGFTGLTYVDYTISHDEGETGRARIFVRVM